MFFVILITDLHFTFIVRQGYPPYEEPGRRHAHEVLKLIQCSSEQHQS